MIDDIVPALIAIGLAWHCAAFAQEPLAKRGATYCGEPPQWWLDSPAGFIQQDNFVEGEELHNLLQQVQAAAEGGWAP